MLEGITILNQTEIMTISNAGLIWTIILCVVGFVGAILFASLSDEYTECVIGVIVCIVLFFIGIGIAATDDSKSTGRYEYEVLIDESVSFEDVYKNYDVVEQKGKMWILEDKKKTSDE